MSTPPAASVILFTYNQQDFVESAAHSILAQDAPPLEIIFSDDASTDQTFAILQRIAKAYRGPHSVKALRNDTNMGIASHVLDRCAQAAGPVVILAAGDDLSDPNRAREVLQAFSDETVLGCFSPVRLIGPTGQDLASHADRPKFLAEPEVFAKATQSAFRVIQGCSAAYRKSLFPVNLPNGRKQYAEDILLSFLIHCRRGKIVKLDKALVAYRQHENSLSNRPLAAMLSPDAVEQEMGQLPGQLALYRDIENLAQAENANDVLDRAALERARGFAQDKLHWAEWRWPKRAKSVLGSLFPIRRSELQWKLLRLWGKHPHYVPMRIARWVIQRGR